MNKTCDRCSKTIPHGSAYICIAHNVEQHQTDIARQQDYVQVISSEEALILCGQCGNAFNAKAIKQIIKAIPTHQYQALKN